MINRIDKIAKIIRKKNSQKRKMLRNKEKKEA